ncbi:hypothetical protein BDZ97DRAFT_1759151 [Flammula alnicola]|nr:hypothetical protein BDZ97DRAFT_1759151 [Flammula alnicola]
MPFPFKFFTGPDPTKQKYISFAQYQKALEKLRRDSVNIQDHLELQAKQLNARLQSRWNWKRPSTEDVDSMGTALTFSSWNTMLLGSRNGRHIPGAHFSKPMLRLVFKVYTFKAIVGNLLRTCTPMQIREVDFRILTLTVGYPQTNLHPNATSTWPQPIFPCIIGPTISNNIRPVAQAAQVTLYSPTGDVWNSFTPYHRPV